ncbi:MAG: hypothetical protein UY72_C0069G0012 [Candidatus Uhrbacteria bacterium GW2011_GWD2_52_7]|uniref:Uncharacterized protein n=1 Tax=Candidatus Uhrbacteria bacterium GW2011_GWD2_52_7 TaxID=1618989 RepID=A0A0G1XB59_9BACT|nr:MAG: hypothetical protein UY72_C0069G0012 [Candidatus Uhrbacteria bacterium GW2011_GWD2_52_7]
MSSNLYRQHRGGGGGAGRFFRAASIVILAGGGAAFVLWAITWFRSSADAKRADAEATQEAEVAAEVEANEQVSASAVMRDATGASIGLLTRSGTVEFPSYDLVVRLPAIDLATSSYSIWLLQVGLADVKFVGDALPRADGSWAFTFMGTDPLDYPQVVITLEPNDGNTLPSGNRVAEGEFTSY